MARRRHTGCLPRGDGALQRVSGEMGVAAVAQFERATLRAAQLAVELHRRGKPAALDLRGHEGALEGLAADLRGEADEDTARRGAVDLAGYGQTRAGALDLRDAQL